MLCLADHIASDFLKAVSHKSFLGRNFLGITFHDLDNLYKFVSIWFRGSKLQNLIPPVKISALKVEVTLLIVFLES